MRAIDHQGVFILVEGSNDETILKFVLDIAPASFMMAFGFANVVAAINILDADAFTRALGVIDRDYHGIVLPMPVSANIVLTDDRDLEVHIFNSSAFDRVFTQFASNTKLSKEVNGISDVRNKIYLAAMPMAKVRFMCAKLGGAYKFSDLQLGKFTEKRTLAVDAEKFISHLRGQHEKNGQLDISVLATADAHLGQFDPKLPRERICRGHDLFSFAAFGLRVLWGNFSGSQMTAEHLEGITVVACSKDELRQCGFCSRVINWCGQHGLAA